MINTGYKIRKPVDISVSIPSLSEGNTMVNSPAVNVVSSILGSNNTFYFNDNATCSMSLSSIENLDFGKLTPNDVNKILYKELSVYYSCKKSSD